MFSLELSAGAVNTQNGTFGTYKYISMQKKSLSDTDSFIQSRVIFN